MARIGRVGLTIWAAVLFAVRGGALHGADAGVSRVSDEAIHRIVDWHVRDFASRFAERHLSELDDPRGTINMKIHNVFVSELGQDIQFYTSLSRSLSSSLGNTIEGMAVDLARRRFAVSQSVTGAMLPAQTERIARLLDAYKTRERTPSQEDYRLLNATNGVGETVIREHASDYHLFDPATGTHYILELKIGGDLDNKKARAEKEALMEQYAMLANTLPEGTPIVCHLATAYNRFGEGRPWENSRVLRFFSRGELLIGREFWNFVTGRPDGGDVVVKAYRKSAPAIQAALDRIRRAYLGDATPDLSAD